MRIGIIGLAAILGAVATRSAQANSDFFLSANGDYVTGTWSAGSPPGTADTAVINGARTLNLSNAVGFVTPVTRATATIVNDDAGPVGIYDIQGRRVRTLVDQDAAAGTFRASWDGRTDTGATSNGVFFARLVVDGQATDTRKIVIR